MPIALEDAKAGMADKVDQQIVDMFRRSSLLLDRLTFDNAISPGTGGSTLVYGYTQLKTPSTAAVRTINSEYTATEAKREKKTTQAIIMGGAFEVDRVIQDTSGAIDELVFQADEKIKATANFFTNCVINGTMSGPAAPGKTTALSTASRSCSPVLPPSTPPPRTCLPARTSPPTTTSSLTSSMSSSPASTACPTCC